MKPRSKYSTRQKELVFSYVSENRDKHLTAKMIAEALSDQVGQATVYRTLVELAEQKMIARLDIDKGRGAYFKYLDKNESSCHLLCRECGKLIELDCDFVTELSDHISEEHGFSVDKSTTVLHGNCQKCR